MKGIIVAGGLGTRLRPLTNDTPKPLLPIQGKPTLLYAVENMRECGIKDIVLAISFNAEKIIDALKDGKKWGVKFEYSIEEDPLGTGGAIKQASREIDGDFVVQWGDNLMDIDYSKIVETHKKSGALVTMALTAREDVENFGVAKLEGDKILEFIEKPAREDAPSNLINAGCFVMNKRALDILPEGKSSIEKDCFEKLAPEGKVFAYKHEGQWFPTDTLEKYELANKEWKC